MVTVHFPLPYTGWIALAVGVILVLAHMRGVDTPRPWIEWIERRFAYSIRMRFVGGIQLAVCALAWWLLRPDPSLLAVLAKPMVIVIGLSGVAMLATQDLARHLVIAVAEQNDLTIRIVAGFVTLAGLALVVLPFLI